MLRLSEDELTRICDFGRELVEEVHAIQETLEFERDESGRLEEVAKLYKYWAKHPFIKDNGSNLYLDLYGIIVGEAIACFDIPRMKHWFSVDDTGAVYILDWKYDMKWLTAPCPGFLRSIGSPLYDPRWLDINDFQDGSPTR